MPIPPALAQRYLVAGASGQQYLKAIVGLSPDAKPETWEARGLRFRPVSRNWRTADIPLTQLYAVLRSTDFTHLELDSRCYPTMDTARAMQDVDRVHAGEGSLAVPYQGTGVLVGVVDHGYDWSHPAFFSQDGQCYRVLRVWDQHRNVAATPPADYDYGHELIGQTALLASPIDSVEGFHGTHVLGIAAGSGLGSGKDRGMAPDADIVLVSSPFTRSTILDGIRYLFAQADALDKDMVINLSIGGFLGPRDGTSSFDLAVGELVGPGRIVVGAAGNEGAKPYHTSKQFANSQDTLRTILTMDSVDVNRREAYLLMYTQGTGNMHQRFRVLDPQGNVVFTAPRQYTTQISGIFSGIDTLTWNPGDTLFINADVPRNAFLHSTPWAYMGFILTLKSANPDLHVATYVIRTSGGTTIPHLWCGWGAGGKPLVDTLPGSSTPLPGFQPGDTQYTITETGGTGRRTISVGNLTARTHFTNIKQVVVANDTSDGKGTLAYSSSKGPSLDQRVKPDLVATGNSLTAPFSYIEAPFDSSAVVYAFEHDGRTRYMASIWGTSMASPCVTGTVALMLQARPGMDFETVRSILQQTAVTDAATGVVPNMHYGHGKLNTYEAVLMAQTTVNRDNRLREARMALLFHNPGTGSPRLRLLHTQGSPVAIRVLDASGRTLAHTTHSPHSPQGPQGPDVELPVPMDQLAAGVYLVQVQQGGWVQYLPYHKLR